MLIHPKLLNSNFQQNEYLFCPSKNCLNIPEIYYSYNPLKQDVQYRCKCQVNDRQLINMNIQEFLEKSNIYCQSCKQIITGENCFICSDCNNIFDNNCIRDHYKNSNHTKFSSKNIQKITNLCKIHNAPFIFRCKNCNELLCLQCVDFHNNNGHSLKQMFKYFIDSNDFDKINSTFEQQKNILEQIKKINNDLITSLENDLKIKQKIINNYRDNKANYYSNINIKNLYVENDKKYEIIFQNILSKTSEELSHGKDIDKFLDEILLIFYYSLMIIKDKSFVDDLLDNMCQKLCNLKNSVKQDINYNNKIESYSNIEKNKNNDSNIIFNSINNNSRIIFNSKSETKDSVNINSSNIKNDLFSLNKKNFENKNLIEKEYPPNPRRIIINNENVNDENTIIIETSKPKKIINDDDSIEESEEKNFETETKTKNDFINNMVALKSGNFAISNDYKIEIYDFRKLDYSKENSVFDDEFIRNSNCLLQEIYITNDSKGKYISYIFQFTDETLLCAVYSKIIRIKLTNNDKNHEIIGYIKLEDLELSRKLISLGNSLLGVLSEKGNDCFIKIYSNDNNFKVISDNNNIKIFFVTNQNNNIEKIENKGLHYVIKNENNNKNIMNIKQDFSFKKILDNFNQKEKLLVSIFEIKKDFNEKIEDNFPKYSYEFVATSNTGYKFGMDQVIFYGIIKDNKGKYHISTIDVINNISCSVEPDSICQINKKYLCIGLQNYGKPLQASGFALIDIFTRKLIKIISDKPINCLYYDIENRSLMASMEVIKDRYRYYYTKIYKIIINEGDEENDKIEFIEIYNHENGQYDTMISINKIPNEKLIYVTLSFISVLEIVKTHINNN